MLEYRIVTQNGTGRPYSLTTYNNFTQCYAQLLALIAERQDDYTRGYYVLNDFYDNKYPPLFGEVTKYRIERREVEEWEMVSEENEASLQEPKKKKKSAKKSTSKKSNIIQMFA